MPNAQPAAPTFSLSTNWNSARHTSGGAMVDEILKLGFDAVELGYQLDEQQAADVLRRVRQGGVAVSSVHAFCPAPAHVAGGHPELYLAASLDEDDRVMAVLLAGKTLEFAQQAGARAVILHAGRIQQGWWRRGPDSESLLRLASDSGTDDPRFQKQTARALRARERRAGRHLEALRRSLDRLVPCFEKAGVALCLENLPSWEAVPSEDEIARLAADYPAPALAYWHDLGHGQVRQHLGWSPDHAAVAAKLLPITRGIHIHDVCGLADDHQVPGKGVLDFTRFAFYGTAEVIRVFEPLPGTPATALAAALAHLRQIWGGGRCFRS
jgi:sugar phosphate isomerase/epimerase